MTTRTSSTTRSANLASRRRIQGGVAVVHRTRADDHEQAVILPVENAHEIVARAADHVSARRIQRKVVGEQGWRDQRSQAGDSQISRGLGRGFRCQHEPLKGKPAPLRRASDLIGAWLS